MGSDGRVLESDKTPDSRTYSATEKSVPAQAWRGSPAQAGAVGVRGHHVRAAHRLSANIREHRQAKSPV